MQPAPNLPSLTKKLNVPVPMVTEARAHRMVDEALYKAREEQAEMLNERASQLELLKYKNKRFRAIIVDLKKKNDSLDLECEKYLDRIDRLKSALRERTLAYDSLQLRHMDLTTANENLKLRLARKSRPNTAGSRRSKRSKSPRNSRPVSASVVAGLAKGQSNQQQLDDAEGKARPRPKSAGSLSSSSRSIGSLRPSSAGSLRPSSAGSMSSGTSSTSSKKVAFAGPAIDDGKNIRPGSGHSVLSPVKEIREEEEEDQDSREEDERKETDKSSDGEETKNKDGDSSSEGSSSNEKSNEDSDEDSGGEGGEKKKGSNVDKDKAQHDKKQKDSEDIQHTEKETSTDKQKEMEDMRPYTADALPSALNDPYVQQVLEARPMTAPEMGSKDPIGEGKKKKRRIAFPKRKPKRVAKVKEPPKKRRRDPNEELSELEIIKKAPEPDERDELENLYQTWGGKRWYILLLVQGIQCEANKMHRHACSGTSAVCFFIFGIIRFVCFFTVSGAGLAISDLAFIFLGILSQYILSQILYQDQLLKRLILFMVTDKGRDYFGRKRFRWCIYVLPFTVGLGSSILYNAMFVIEMSKLDSPFPFFYFAVLSVPFSIFFSQVVWHAIGIYVFMQLSLSAYIMEKKYITRDLDNHLQTFYKVRCMVDDATMSLGKHLCTPLIPICGVGVFQNILELYFVDDSANAVDSASLAVFQVLNYGFLLTCMLYFGGVVNHACSIICATISERMITSIEDDEKMLKLKARIGALGDNDPTTTRLDKHQKFPLLLFDLTLNSTSKNLTFMYSYVSNKTEMGFKVLGMMLQKSHGLFVGILILSVIINGGGN